VSRLVLFSIASSLAMLVVGCPHPEPPRYVSLYAASGAPPARRIQVVSNDKEHRLTLTSGVALAVTLGDDCPYEGSSPRPPPTMTIADETILKSRGLVRGTAENHWVLWGARPGSTTLTLRASCATQVYEVDVVAP
jgi:hypothetical protein